MLLFVLQIQYAKKTNQMVNGWFNESVQRCLYSASKFIEEAEVADFIARIEETDIDEMVNAIKFDKLQDNKGNESLSLLNYNLQTRAINTSIQAIYQYYNAQNYRSLASTQNLVDAIILKRITKATRRNITERIDPILLRNAISDRFKHNNITTDFSFAVADKNLKKIYTFDEKPFEITPDCYRQQLFMSDKSSTPYYLYLKFNDNKKYNYGTYMITPLIIITTILLIMIIVISVHILKHHNETKIKTDFINNMTHELKTPVSSISLASQMLSDPDITKTPVMLNHISKVIKDESKRLSFLIEKVLQMSLYEQQQVRMKFVSIDINQTISAIASNFSLKVESNGGTLNQQLNATNPYAEVDDMHFNNVIYNLLDNAVKYSRPDVPIILTIATWNSQNRLYISITDNGIGMSKDEQKHVFDKFYRAPTGNQHNVKGFGLGLSYVKKIVEEHQGRITVISEPNVGSTFTIDLPSIA